MARVASILTCICTALWLGGMVYLFIAVQTLFSAFPRPGSTVAVEAAPRLFGAFERYQLILACVALLAAFAWSVATRSRLAMTAFILIALAGAAAAVSSTLITPKMQQLRVEGKTATTPFRRLHGQSMIIYTSQAALLLAAAIVVAVAPVTRSSTPATRPNE